jgi:hypothetical protein
LRGNAFAYAEFVRKNTNTKEAKATRLTGVALAGLKNESGLSKKNSSNLREGDVNIADITKA